MPELGERVANLEARFDAIGQDTAEIREIVKRLDDRIDGRFQALDRKMESRFQAMDEKMESRFQAMDEKMESRFQAMDEKIESRFQAMDGRMEARFLAVDGRFLTMDGRFDRLESRMADGFRELRADMHTNFRWVMGGMGGALLATLLAIIGAVFAIRP